ncbi:hypothetical protein BD779DRAFT_1672910 [Infundibulicybe gibba]|nr:hypothetical protein BD779DRAFT_1672910 [Infundibulicybe gibba]
MYIKSPYPNIPPLPTTNSHDIFFNQPEQAEWPDYTVHIDSATGFKRTRREFNERVRDGATALGAPVSAGGLGLRGGDHGEMIGIMSENAMDYATLVHSLLVITTPFALISSYSTPFELKHALNLSKPTRLFVAAEYIPLVLPLAREIGISPHKIYVLGGHARGWRSFSEMIDDARAKQIPRNLFGLSRGILWLICLLQWYERSTERMHGSTSPGMEARIIRDDGSEAEVNEIGELYLKGENVALGYWNNETASQETFVDGWLRTGDKFRFNENGYFYYADRSKDTLKVSGSQVSPVEIENVLLAHPRRLIIDATVAGVSGGRTSDERVPRAWVVLSGEGEKAGASAVIRELEAWHQENLSKFKWLRGGIEIVKEIPKSPTGKTLRRVLQDRYEQQFAKVKGKL